MFYIVYELVSSVQVGQEPKTHVVVSKLVIPKSVTSPVTSQDAQFLSKLQKWGSGQNFDRKI